MIWTLSYLNMLHLLCSNIHCDPDHYSPAVPPHLPPSILFLLLCCGYFLFWTSHGTYLINLLSFKTHVHKFPCIVFQTMKNVRCKKLLIDRSKAPGKVGTLKDISLFGNFKFPSDGPYKGGIIAQSLAGVGKVLSKTKAQVQTIALRSVPIAGATGASTTDDVLRSSDERVDGQGDGGDAYSVKFIQLNSDDSGNVNLTPMNSSVIVNADDRPSPAFALKKGGAKKVTFTKEQKDIMAAFYENQRTLQIRANPADVIEAMKAAGVPPLKESQIKSW